MAFKVVRSTQFDDDLDHIHEHLIGSYAGLGDTFVDAFDRATRRLDTLEADLDAIARSPYQGTLTPQIAQGLRHVTKNMAVFYFDIDEDSGSVVFLAVFFGGQDHHRHMSRRMKQSS
jgi:plasmid stabilization system protein ParE